MLNTPMDVLERFPVRKSGKQKAAFRAAVQAYAMNLGYEYREEKGSFGCRNVMIGNPENAEFLVTAHYDTCARLPIPNFLTPCNLWLFLLWQLTLVLLILGVLSSLFLGSYLGQKFDAVFGWIIAIGGIAQSVFVYLCLKVFVNISENMRKIKNYLLFRDGLDDDEEPDYVAPETSDDSNDE